MSDTPSLVEPDVKYFIENSLKKAHEYRMNTYSFIFNFGILAIFTLVFGGFLYYRYKNKPSPYEVQQKMKKDQEIILSKIRANQDDRKRGLYKEMTSMPFVDMDKAVRDYV